jgi:hypothetical protein
VFMQWRVSSISSFPCQSRLQAAVFSFIACACTASTYSDSSGFRNESCDIQITAVVPHFVGFLCSYIRILIINAYVFGIIYYVYFVQATISSVLSVRLSVRMEKLGSHWTYFNEM